METAKKMPKVSLGVIFIRSIEILELKCRVKI
jgi:hypothetical protein